MRVTYHDPCHLGRKQGVTEEPRAMLRRIPGLELVEMREGDWCCGGAGSYNLSNPDMSEKILARKLNMNLVTVERQFDHKKITFYFTAEKRVDFRELVRDLAGIFRTRIELRQIGVRDEARLKGGIGVCGREFCCSTFLHEFVPVTLKMAKVQSLPLNPGKLSGPCGRLRCCLTYENEVYREARRSLPTVPVSSSTGRFMLLPTHRPSNTVNNSPPPISSRLARRISPRFARRSSRERRTTAQPNGQWSSAAPSVCCS